jgi:hypothetical protein
MSKLMLLQKSGESRVWQYAKVRQAGFRLMMCPLHLGALLEGCSLAAPRGMCRRDRMDSSDYTFLWSQECDYAVWWLEPYCTPASARREDAGEPGTLDRKLC